MDNTPKPTHLYHIGKMVRQIREFKGFTQQQLGEKANIRRSTVTDIENGNTNFEINTLVAITAALNCSLNISLTPND